MRLFLPLFLGFFGVLVAGAAFAADARNVVVAQLSDLHLGMASHPGSEARLQQAIEMLKKRHIDGVIVSGDIGDNYEPTWKQAREMLSALRVPVYYVPGNHDVTSKTGDRYKAVFGPDYYTFDVKGIHFVALDSQRLGSFSDINSQSPEKLAREDEAAAAQMLQWAETLKLSGPVVAVQHAPPDQPSPALSPDPRPYWTLHAPWRARESAALHALGIRHVLCGHWHQATLYDVGGLHIHVAPATSWSPKSPLGFALHTISPDGDVRTEFVFFDKQPFLNK